MRWSWLDLLCSSVTILGTNQRIHCNEKILAMKIHCNEKYAMKTMKYFRLKFIIPQFSKGNLALLNLFLRKKCTKHTIKILWGVIFKILSQLCARFQNLNFPKKIQQFFEIFSAWNWKFWKTMHQKCHKIPREDNSLKKFLVFLPKLSIFLLLQFHCFHCFHCNDFVIFIASLQWMKSAMKSPVYL